MHCKQKTYEHVTEKEGILILLTQTLFFYFSLSKSRVSSWHINILLLVKGGGWEEVGAHTHTLLHRPNSHVSQKVVCKRFELNVTHRGQWSRPASVSEKMCKEECLKQVLLLQSNLLDRPGNHLVAPS